MCYQNFARLCEERGVTPYSVCKATGISTATISSWKSGKYKPKQEKLRILADYFGVPFEYLMEAKNGNTDAEKIGTSIMASPEMRILFDSAEGARKEDILIVADILRRMKAK